ncbi:hypothetical protein [Halomonas sp. M4R1S46]|uniref:hypothetical protein n=1 Tax=Halomonas sp. M4R1S46 TaxID=2982692 RepID=UPI0021E48060|nr:hypothetical protein [Halomonas sp. M4R1S46]UYG07542.1 hypothetical protein OCT48_18245 [Halomonas sp. M4R1S46]
MQEINFILTCEGTSDANLVEHLKNLLIQRGADEVSGQHADLSILRKPPGGSVREKLNAINELYPEANVVFIHRDADNQGAEERANEIKEQSENFPKTTIPLIPVKITETWLLADKEKITEITGVEPNNIPPLKNLEKSGRAKEILMDCLTSGVKKKQKKTTFYRARAQLCQELRPEGPVSMLASYNAFTQKIDELFL